VDIVRNTSQHGRGRKIGAIAGVVAALVIVTVALARLGPAAPSIQRSTVVIDTVQRGPFTRQIRAAGTLVPENIRWIAAATDARVERVLVQPGTAVQADTVLIELSDPQQTQNAREAEWNLRAAEAAYEAAVAELESERLERQAALGSRRAEHAEAKLRAAADADLEKAGLVAKITRTISQTNADELGRQVQFEEQRLRRLQESQRARLAVLRAQVEQRRAMNELARQQADSLLVRAGIDGVLQQVSVQAGQRVPAGANLARVAEPRRLKGEIRVAEVQAKDVVVGQRATIDTRNGVVEARVARVDPAVVNGTVVVDLAITQPLPTGARPDLTIDATIELDRVAQALFVSRPVAAREMSPGSLFKVEGNDARRVNVQFGRASAEAIEIRSGLEAGDAVIVSDTSAYEPFDRLELN
jgi:HlyD family secretion protein